MTDSVTYSRPYAEAAYKIAVESNATSLWADNLMILSEVIKDAEVKAIIASPRVDDSKSLSFLNSFLEKDDASFSNFLSIMISNKKVYFLTTCISRSVKDLTKLKHLGAFSSKFTDLSVQYSMRSWRQCVTI